MIDPETFLRIVRPALQTGDAELLAHAVSVRWRASQVCRLLGHTDVDVRRVAAVALGMIGDHKSLVGLTRALRDPDEQVNEMADFALRSIWNRSGSSRAAEPFRQGVELLARDKFDEAIDKFHEATQIDPSFAEAYNQCAIAHFFVGQWRLCLADSRRTIRLIPAHFGAIAGMGHCFAEMGEFDKALRCYRRALRINPRLGAIAEAISRLEQKVSDPESSGEFLVAIEQN
jgi:tetratricopeptide (TPR) repeat protein